jgi:hypothetical protein
VLTVPRSLTELEQNLVALESPPICKKERGQWQRFGDLVYAVGKGAFETRWPKGFLYHMRTLHSGPTARGRWNRIVQRSLRSAGATLIG